MSLQPDLADAALPSRLITLRAVVLGLLGVAFVGILTPFNDYVLRNTNLVGSFLALGVLMWLMLLVLGINLPLTRWAPSKRLGSGELVVITGMVLVGSALPSVGLMRYLPGHLVGFWVHSGTDEQTRTLMRALALPDWLFPTMQDADPLQRSADPVIRDFYNRVPLSERNAWSAIAAVPFRAWLRPALMWGLFIAMLFSTLIALMVVFRRQWVENERLPFPLAQVYLSLIETPAPGRLVNTLLGSRVFWIAAGSVFLLHGINGLRLYAPTYFPEIPLRYDFTTLFAERPWNFMQPEAKTQKAFFTIIGLTFFLRTQLAFSLVFFFVVSQVLRMRLGSVGGELTATMAADQQFGAVGALAGVTLWIARRHLRAVVGQMFRAPRADEPRGRYLPYRFAGWTVALGFAGMVVWLASAGMSVTGAIILVLMMLTLFLVLARVVAETGIPYVLLPVEFHRVWLIAANDLPGGWSVRTTLPSYFFHSWFFGMFAHDTRENLAPFASQALRVADREFDQPERAALSRRTAYGFVACLALALVVGFVASGASYLVADYNNAVSRDRRQESPLNSWGAFNMPKAIAIDNTVRYMPPAAGPAETHSRPAHVAVGAAITGALGWLRLTYANWPLHPIGFVLVYSWGLRNIVFSVFLGWLAKTAVVRLGGASLLTRARPVFIGLILGEVSASAFWLIVAAVNAVLGNEYFSMQLAPE